MGGNTRAAGCVHSSAFQGYGLTERKLALKASAQTAQQWTDPLTSISFYRHYDSGTDTAWGFVFPPLQPTSNEFIGFFIAPRNSGWIGTSLGGRMTSNLLILGWTNGATPIVSPRFTT